MSVIKCPEATLDPKGGSCGGGVTNSDSTVVNPFLGVNWRIVNSINTEFAKSSGEAWGRLSGVNQNCIVKENFCKPPHQWEIGLFLKVRHGRRIVFL